ncbi:hypothetical protein TorRG33x02_295940 [Trema orientale]|uniref:Uncharacterized protein n=1 Tax=Trema orientale TaxID=63057 RepID=A0A2P5C6D4_TREOI|nr:hypothetical protein TorRG33x02_295940 [Trema orientale]
MISYTISSTLDSRKCYKILHVTMTKANICYRRSFLNNHFFRAVTSMATNILAFLSSSKSSQASKKSSSFISGTVSSAATTLSIEQWSFSSPLLTNHFSKPGFSSNVSSISSLMILCTFLLHSDFDKVEDFRFFR